MGPERRAGAIVLTLLLAIQWQVFAERLPFTRLTVAQGLAHNRVGRIIQDSHGFLWFCSPAGLSRFDGQSFVNYGAQEGLFHEAVNDLLEDGATYWIATNGGGIVRFDPPPEDNAGAATTPFRTTRFAVGGSAATNRVNVLHRDASGTIWAGTDGGLFRQSATAADAGFTLVPLQLTAQPDHTTQVWALVEDAAKNLWIGSRYGLLRRTPAGDITQFTIQSDANTDHVWTLSLFDGRLWLGHYSGVIVLRPPSGTGSSRIALEPRPPERDGERLLLPDVPGDARRFSTREGVPAGPVRAITRSSSESVWIGTDGGGLAELREGRSRIFTREHGLGDMFVSAIAEDRGGNTWIGTRNGVLRLARRGFVNYGESDGLGPMVGTLFEVNGALYATSYEYTLSRFDGLTFSKVKLRLPPGVTGWRSQSILGDRSGGWWVASRDGVFRYTRVQRFENLGTVLPDTLYTTRDGLSSNDVTSLFEDTRSDVWMAHFAPGHDVLTRWERSTNTFHRYSSAHGLRPSSQVSAFGESASGEVWVGFRDGEVGRFNGGRFIQELPPDPRPERRVGTIHHDKSGRVWISILGSGLVRLDPAAEEPVRIRRITVADGLASDNVGVLTEGSHGEIYVEVGHRFGIDRIDPDTGAVRHFTSSDGLPIADYFSAYRDQSNNVWFGTTVGLLRFTPGIDPPVQAPEIRIGGLQIAGAAVAVHPLGAADVGPFVLSPDRNRVALNFFGVSPSLDDSLRYQYRLEGADEEWSPLAEQRAVNYANLAPGRYRFAVRAVNKEGGASVSPATVTFMILPPIWRRWWFVASAAMSLGLLAWFVHRYRLRRAIEIERVRMRIATDLHDDIGAGLSQVSVLSAVVSRRVGSDPAVAAPVAAIGELSGDLVDSMSDIVWAINPHRDHASDLIHRMRRFASELLGAKDVDLTFVADAEDEDVALGPDVRREVWLIFKESVNNIARHSRCTRGGVNLRIAQQRLELRVWDNGIGFAPEAAADGNGLASMRQRAARIGGVLSIDAQSGQGTTVSVGLPIGQGHRRFR